MSTNFIIANSLPQYIRSYTHLPKYRHTSIRQYIEWINSIAHYFDTWLVQRGSTATGGMKEYISVHIPYTTKSKNGNEYIKYKRQFIEKIKAQEIVERYRRQQIDNIING